MSQTSPHSPDTIATAPDQTPLTYQHDPERATPTLSAPTIEQSEPALVQVQHRLFQLATQIDQIQTQLARLVNESQFSSSQLVGITRHLTDVQVANVLSDHVAELTTQLATQQERLDALVQTATHGVRQEQIEQLAQAIARTASQEQMERLAQAVAGRAQLEQLAQAITKAAQQEQVERLAQAVAQTAHQTQVERLLQIVAEREQLAMLEDAIKKLGRTQFKSNTLGETKEQQIASAIATLQEIVTHREQLQEGQTLRNAEEIAAAQRDSLAALAAELLPALDSLELALEHGSGMLDRQRAQLGTVTARYQEYLTAQGQFMAGLGQTPAPGFWQRLRGQGQVAALPPLPCNRCLLTIFKRFFKG
jgi:hypothetical protein